MPISRELSALLDRAPARLDLTHEEHLAPVQRLADELLDRVRDEESLDRLEEQVEEDRPLGARVALKLARSKSAMATLPADFHLSVVFAAYKEHVRIRTREEHEHGENFLLRKIAQLRWLFEAARGATWDLAMVDDGCPEGSGHIAVELLERHEAGGDVRVLFLEDAIRDGRPVTRPLGSPSGSQKGGSILYGMWEATRVERPRHVVLYTDADLSTHLGQAALPAAAILHGNRDAAIGSRREARSVVVKLGQRNVRGKLFIYLWKRILPQLDAIVDTQCGFKAFRADVVREIVEPTIEKRFAFDIELLLKCELRRAGSMAKIPVAWIDSEAASTTTDLQPYLAMLQSVACMYRTYCPRNDRVEPFAAFLERLDEGGWQILVDNVPQEIARRNPAEFGTWAGVGVADLQRVIDGKE